MARNARLDETKIQQVAGEITQVGHVDVSAVQGI